ncbi:MAG TPA: DUF177 domain-containing protein [Bacteroidales bacterium]
MPPDFKRGMIMNEEFIIPFKGLSLGSHPYDYKIGNQFFEHFEYFESERGSLNVHLDLVKESNLMDLHFQLKGNIEMDCDRCLVPFSTPVEGNFRLVVKFGEHFEEESDEIIVLPLTESRLDVGQLIFEYINLLLPLQKAHDDIKDCDPEMIEKLEMHKKDIADSRWDVLKNIKLT